MTFTTNTTQSVGVTKGTAFTVAANFVSGTGTLSVKYFSEGNWVTFASGETGTFTASGERVFENVGSIDEIQLVTTNASSLDLDVIVNSKRF